MKLLLKSAYITNIIKAGYFSNNDLNEKVKGQCIIAMDYLSQFCSPEINEYYDKIIPMLLQGIYSKSEDIIEKSLLEINYFFSLIDFEMEDYLNMNSELNIKLLNKIIELIKTTKNGSIQAKALTALGAVVVNGHNLNTDDPNNEINQIDNSIINNLW